MEESLFQKDNSWKEVLDPSVVFNQVNSLMITLPVNADRSLARKTLFGKENPKFHAENAHTSISETHRVWNLEQKLVAFLKEVKQTKFLGGWKGDYNR